MAPGRSIVWAAVILIAAALSLAGCRARTPGRLETKLVDGLKRGVTVRGKNDKNPFPTDAETIRSGRKAFSQYCMVCHGLDGQNTGVPFADRMSPPVANLTSREIQAYTDGQLKWIVENGISPSGMPASKDLLSQEEMWWIVIYIRNLPPAGSLGEPAAYSGNQEQPRRKPR